MIQRKQSLYLLLAAILSLASWLFPIATFDLQDGRHLLRTTGLYDPTGLEDAVRALAVPFQWLHTVLAALLLLSIILYGNRPRQQRLVRVSYLLALALLAFQYIARNSSLAYLAQRGAVESGYGITFFIPAVVLVLAFLAERAIRSDESLVRSMDRLR